MIALQGRTRPPPRNGTPARSRHRAHTRRALRAGHYDGRCRALQGHALRPGTALRYSFCYRNEPCLPKGLGRRDVRPVHHCPHSRDGRPAGQPARETDQLAARAPTRTAICRNLRFLRRFDSSTRWLGAKGRTKLACVTALRWVPPSSRTPLTHCPEKNVRLGDQGWALAAGAAAGLRT